MTVREHRKHRNRHLQPGPLTFGSDTERRQAREAQPILNCSVANASPRSGAARIRPISMTPATLKGRLVCVIAVFP